nr:MFS transporter [Streptomyces sp. HPF1205]
MPTASSSTDPRAVTLAPKAGYRQLLTTPGVWAFLLPGFLARLPFAMLTISLVLLVENTTGSYGTAGTVAAVTGVSMALCAPRAGRLADRFGQRAVLVPGVVLHAVSVAVLVTLGVTHAPAWALLVAAVPTGATVSQIGPMVRSRWVVALQEERPSLMTTAAAFESVTDEFTFVIGPVLATALCAGLHPAAGMITEGALTLMGGILFAARRGGAPAPSLRAPRTDAVRSSALSVPGVRALVVAFLGIGAVFGGLQVSLTAFTHAIGRPGINGVLYGAFAAGNMVAGAVYGAVGWRRRPQGRLLGAYAALTLACAPLWAMRTVPSLAALGLVVGLCIAPALITGYTLIDTLVPAAIRTEAFTWLTGAVAFGQAAAVTTAGALIDRAGFHAGFAVPLAGTALALTWLSLLRRHLVSPAAGTAGTGVVGHPPAVTVD